MKRWNKTVWGGAVRGWAQRFFGDRLEGFVLSKIPKISFCTTCMGRLPHLEQTFLKNMEDNKDYPRVEFVLLNYGADSQVRAWALENLSGMAVSGHVRYYETEPYPYYHSAHAKNAAHRLASGDIVCNLDADNFTGAGFAAFLAELFLHRKKKIVHGHYSIQTGSTGRIALLRSAFLKLGGYNEALQGWGADDQDLIERAVAAGFEDCWIKDVRFLNIIQHGDEERVRHFPAEFKDAKQSNLQNRERTRQAIRQNKIIANAGMPWGRAKIISRL